MQMPYIITLEGFDGAGKETTTKALKIYLESKGYKVKTVSFPMYDKWHSFLVRFFLKGKFGNSPYSVSPRIASLFYSFDRFFAYHFGLKWEIQDEEYHTGTAYDFIIFDRYTTASMLYQGAKGKNFYDKLRIAKYIEFIEYSLLRLPRPDKVFILKTTVGQSLDAMKSRDFLDINEKHTGYQEQVREFSNSLINVYKWFPITTRKPFPPYDWYPVQDIVDIIYAFIDYEALKKK